MNNLSSYCGLVDAKIRASDKDLPVPYRAVVRFSKPLILASTNLQYEKRLFIELPAQYMKTTSSEHGDNMLCTQIVFCFCFDIQNNFCTQHVLPMF